MQQSAGLHSGYGSSEKSRHLTERYAFESTDQGLIYLDANGAVVAINAVAEQLLGVLRNHVVWLALADWWPASIREDSFILSLAEHPALLALRSGKSVPNVVMGLFNKLRDAYIWISVSSIPEFKSGASEPYRVLMILTEMR